MYSIKKLFGSQSTRFFSKRNSFVHSLLGIKDIALEWSLINCIMKQKSLFKILGFCLRSKQRNQENPEIQLGVQNPQQIALYRREVVTLFRSFARLLPKVNFTYYLLFLVVLLKFSHFTMQSTYYHQKTIKQFLDLSWMNFVLVAYV